MRLSRASGLAVGLLVLVLAGLVGALSWPDRAASRRAAPDASDVSSADAAHDRAASAVERAEASAAVSAPAPSLAATLDVWTGVVVDAAGRPVEDAAVRRLRETTRTDRHGRFRLRPSGSASRTPTRAHHPEHGAGESVGDGPLRITLHPASRIRGRVVGRDGGSVVKGIFGFSFWRNRNSWSDVASVPDDGTILSDPFYTLVRRRVVVSVHSDSHDSVRRVVTLAPGHDVHLGVLTLEPKPRAGTVSGRIVGAASGDKLVIGWGTFVRGDGTFVARHMRPGRVQLRAFARPYPYVMIAVGPPVQLAPGGHVRDYVIRVRPRGTLIGRIVGRGENTGGLHVLACSDAGAHFDPDDVKRALGGMATTDASGRFRIPNLVPGRYRVAVVGDRSLDLRFSIYVQHWMHPVEIDVESGENEITLELPSSDVVRGRVVAKDGDVLHDLRGEVLHASGARIPVEIAASGEFAFDRPRGGGHRFLVRARDRAPQWLEIHSRAKVRVLHWPELGLDHGRWIQGVVLAPDGEPAVGAQVRLVAGKGAPFVEVETRCDSEGRFEFPHATRRAAELRVQYAGASPSVLRLDRLDPFDLRIRLERAADR